MLFFTLLFSCQTEKDKNEALKQQVIAVHDEVMPEIGELKTQKERLLEKANALEGNEETAVYREELNAAADSCESAYDAMFVWMRQFKSEYTEMTEEETQTYLQGQLQMVEKVKADILSALSTAEELLQRDV
ncbi:hypothetical protein SAMN04488057_10894 [Cyclobacterium lianum]|uniref:Uncharacterized protein n=2 Tax=Cyclobacterium lianum TaxID=388280 RepID=A0A1M7PDU4_9BACT|nr:hypothetical protein SAMN04488057_10894 [Cyclobacterium lianum]